MTDESHDVPADPAKRFAYFVSACANGLMHERLATGSSEAEARNQIIHYLLDFACGEACRLARREGREPDRDKWFTAVNRAFDKAVIRTVLPLER